MRIVAEHVRRSSVGLPEAALGPLNTSYGAGIMWPFESGKKKAVVVFHIDNEGHARGAYFRGDADVLIIDERDPNNRVHRMGSEASDEELRRRIGKHPLARTLDEKRSAAALPVLNLHWRVDGPQPV